MPSQVHFSSLAEIAHLVNASSDLGTMLDRITFATCHYTAWDMCSIMSVDESAGLSVLMARFDPFLVDPAAAPRTWDLSSSPVRKVLSSNKPLIINNAQENSDYPYYREDARARNYHTATILPLPAKDQYGRPMVVAVQSRQSVNVDEDAISFLEAAAQLAAIAVGKAQRLREESVLAERVRHTIESVGELMRGVLSDKAPTDVVTAVESLLGCPAAVADHSAQAMIVGHGASDSRWSEVLAEQLRSDLQHSISERSNPTAQARKSANTGSGEIGDLREVAYRRETLLVDGEKAGSFYLLIGERRFDQVDEMLIQQVTFALSVLLMRTVIRFKERTETQSKILEDLLSGRETDQEEMMARAARSGFPLGTPTRLVLIGIGGNQEQARRTLRNNHRAISFAIGAVWPGSVNVVAVGNWLVALASDMEHVSENRWTDLLNRLFGSLKSLLSEALVFAPSELCHDVQDYSRAWESCERAFMLADRFGRRGIVLEKNFGVHALIFAAMPMRQVDAFLSNVLTALEEHDAQHRGDMLRTVEAYLTSGCKLQKCADRLKIHVTTLRYRLNRMGEISALDLENGDDRFALELALRLRQMRETPLPHNKGPATVMPFS